MYALLQNNCSVSYYELAMRKIYVIKWRWLLVQAGLTHSQDFVTEAVGNILISISVWKSKLQTICLAKKNIMIWWTCVFVTKFFTWLTDRTIFSSGVLWFHFQQTFSSHINFHLKKTNKSRNYQINSFSIKTKNSSCHKFSIRFEWLNENTCYTKKRKTLLREGEIFYGKIWSVY